MFFRYILFAFFVTKLAFSCVLIPSNPYGNNHDQNIPLKSLNVTGDLIDFAGRVKIIQKYRNNYNQNIEAKYQFTLDERATVTHMGMVIGGQRLISVVKEKSEAREEYNQAIQDRKATSLLEKAFNGIYSMNVGNIPPNEEVEIELEYVTELDSSDKGEMKFVLPTNIFPKYFDSDQTTSRDRSANQATIDQLHYSSSIPYQFYLDLNWTSQSRIESVRSFSNEIEVKGLHENKVMIRSLTAPSKGDFNLFVKTAEIGPTVYVHRDQEKGESHLMIVHRIPEEISEQAEDNREYIILIDRSGSMGESMNRWSGTSQNSNDNNNGRSYMKIDLAREAVQLFMESLPVGSTFNVVSFGTRHEKLFPSASSVEYNEKNKEFALNQIARFQADFGGTELLQCLSDVLKDNKDPAIDLKKREWKAPSLKNETTASNESKKEKERIVLLLTDGAVSNPDAVLSLIQNHRQNTRFFSIGIGQDANRHLVEGIARASHGKSEMLVDNPDVASVVVKMMDLSTKAYYKSTSFTLKGPHAAAALKEEKREDVIYPNSYAIFYQKISSVHVGDAEILEISSEHGQTKEEKTWTFPLSLPSSSSSSSSPPSDSSKWISQLYAADKIRRLEAEKDYRNTAEVIRLSVDYQVMSERTSFIVVDEKIQRGGQPLSVNVPHFDGLAGGVHLTSGVGVTGSGGRVNFAAGHALPSMQPTGCPSAAPSAAPSAMNVGLVASKQALPRMAAQMQDTAMSGGIEISTQGEFEVEELVTRPSPTSTIKEKGFEALFPFKRVEGWFELSEASLRVSDLTQEQVSSLAARLKISEAQAFNLLLLQKLREEQSSKYVMILRNLEKWLKKEFGKERLEELFQSL